MYKVESDKAAKIVNSLRPVLIFVTIPIFMTNVAFSWIQNFRASYSLIDRNKYDLTKDDQQHALRALITKRLSVGKVMIYGFLESNVLERIMPEEYAHIWFYPNKQTAYFEHVKTALLSEKDEWSMILPKTITDLFANSDDTSVAKNITIKCHEFQKKIYVECVKQNDRIFVILC